MRINLKIHKVSFCLSFKKSEKTRIVKIIHPKVKIVHPKKEAVYATINA